VDVDLESLVALNLTGLVGAALHRRLCERFGSARAALRAPRSELKRVPGIGDLTSSAIVEQSRSSAAADEIASPATRASRSAHGGPGYPAALSTLHDPPLVLYVRGGLEERDLPASDSSVPGKPRPTDCGRRRGSAASWRKWESPW
jgi:DNA processing protein